MKSSRANNPKSGLVSIIITAYNCGRYLEESIESALSQTYPEIEVIVIDDGSIDNTKDIVKKYEGRVIYAYQKNGGPSSARNAGLRIANGEYISFLDADDIFIPEKTEKQVGLLEARSEVDAVYAWCHCIDSNGSMLPQKIKNSLRGDLTENLLEGCAVLPNSLIFRKKIIQSVGLFDEALFTADDWDFCFRASINGFKFDFVPEYLVKYRIHGTSICDNYERCEKNDIKFIEKAYSQLDHPEKYAEKKKKAFFSIYNEHAWHYFAKNNTENGLVRLIKAIEAYPEGFTDCRSYFYFAQCILPRGYRVNEEVYKRASYVKDIFHKAFSGLYNAETMAGDKALLKDFQAAKDMALGWIFYFARDMKEARRHLLQAFRSRPSYLLQPVNVFTFIKSFLSRSMIESLKGRKKTKSILYILDIFPAVSETFILNEILELERQGYEVVVFARRKEDSTPHGIVDKLKAKVVYLPDARSLKSARLTISHLKMLFLHPIKYIKTLRFALKRRDAGHLWFFKVSCHYADMARKYTFAQIHSHFASLASCYSMYISRLLSKPFTFTIHGWYDLFEAPPPDLAERAAAAKKVITISKYNKKYLVSKFGISAEKIEVVHCGVDIDYFCAMQKEEVEEKVVLSVARLDPVKSLDTLIRACSSLTQKMKGFKCIIIGEGKERSRLEKLINNLNLSSQVLLLGSQRLEEIKNYYNKASVFVLPSKHETMGVTTMEAMASGVPVISTNICGIPELVDHGKNGYLFDPEDHTRLTSYMEELLSDDSKRSAFGASGRRKIEIDFSLKNEVNRLTEVWFDEKS